MGTYPSIKVWDKEIWATNYMFATSIEILTDCTLSNCFLTVVFVVSVQLWSWHQDADPRWPLSTCGWYCISHFTGAFSSTAGNCVSIQMDHFHPSDQNTGTWQSLWSCRHSQWYSGWYRKCTFLHVRDSKWEALHSSVATDCTYMNHHPQLQQIPRPPSSVSESFSVIFIKHCIIQRLPIAEDIQLQFAMIRLIKELVLSPTNILILFWRQSLCLLCYLFALSFQ